MTKPILSYINEYVGVNYSNLFDFFKDLKYGTPEQNVNSLGNLLLFIEAKQMEEEKTNDRSNHK